MDDPAHLVIQREKGVSEQRLSVGHPDINNQSNIWKLRLTTVTGFRFDVSFAVVLFSCYSTTNHSILTMKLNRISFYTKSLLIYDFRSRCKPAGSLDV